MLQPVQLVKKGCSAILVDFLQEPPRKQEKKSFAKLHQLWNSEHQIVGNSAVGVSNSKEKKTQLPRSGGDRPTDQVDSPEFQSLDLKRMKTPNEDTFNQRYPRCDESRKEFGQPNSESLPSKKGTTWDLGSLEIFWMSIFI